MSHGSNVFDGTIGHDQAMLGGKCPPFDRGIVNDLPQVHPVVRMSSVDQQLNGGLCRRLAFGNRGEIANPNPKLFSSSAMESVSMPLATVQTFN